MKPIRVLAFLVVSCALAPCIAAAAPARTILPKAASAGDLVEVPGTPEKAELVTLDTSLAGGLLRVRPEEEVAVPGWPVAPGKRADVVLTRREVYAPDAVLWEATKDGMRRVPRSSLVFLWGKAEGTDDVRVMVSVDPATQEMRGFTITPEGAHEMELVPKSWKAGKRYVVGPHDLFLDDNGKAVAKDWKCGVEDLPQLDFVAPTPVYNTEKSAGPAWEKAAITSLHTATVAVETDTQIMTNKFANNTTTASNYIASLFAQMNVIYERDLLVRLLQGTTFLRTSDPYTVNDTAPYDDSTNGTKLNEFTNYWSANEGSVNRALAVMLSGRGGAGAAGVAWVNALCNPGIGYAFSRVYTTGTTPNFGDVLVTAHEIGHNFGSPHTHCYNTIGLANPDNCFSGETYSGKACFSGTQTCPNLPNGTTYNGVTGVLGTLMSYCHLMGSCSSSLVFHPTTVDLLDDIILSHSTGAGACILPLAAAGPTVSSATPKNGLATVSTPLTITGANFQSGATVTFGAGAGTSVVVVNSTTITVVAPPHATGAVRITVTNPGNQAGFLDNAFFYSPAAAATAFNTLTPCRIVDTRNAAGLLGGPSLAANATRSFAITGVCGIPAGTKAISANVTVVAGSATGVFSLYPGNAFPLGTTNLNFAAGQIRANNAVLELATDGT
ncbi:MAG TPA: M12 family metallo-peptidase, partial [Thermoanaerobaculia bacterium]|nr:M12 family metallo-peptidase [Thermoanaerobaculia bacterium]